MDIKAYVLSSQQNIDDIIPDCCFKVRIQEVIPNANNGQNLMLTFDVLTFKDAFVLPVNIPWYMRSSCSDSKYSTQYLTESAASLNSDIVSCAFELATTLESKLSAYCNKVRVLINTMAQDVFVLIPETEAFDTVEKICDALKYEITPNSLREELKAELLIKDYHRQFQGVLDNGVFWDDNRHKGVYSSCIETLIHRDMLDNNMKMGDILLASLILKKCQQETYYRWVFDSGDICIEDSAFFKEYEKEFEKYSKLLKTYIEQSTQEHPLSNWNRAILNLTQVLSVDLLEKRYCLLDEKSSEWKSQKEALKKNFYGLYPIITDESATLEENTHNGEIFSYYPMHYSDEYCYGFLCIPIKMLDRFERFIPAYIHELFHYIPPISRKRRNDASIDIVAHSLLVHLRNEIYTALTKRFGTSESIHKVCEKVYGRYFNNIREYLASGVKYHSHSDDILLNTMNLEMLLPVKTFFESPQKFFEVLCRTDLNINHDRDITDEVEKEIAKVLSKSDFKQQCMFIWKYESESYITTLNSLLRELRSDLAMCSVLNLNLYDYLKLMCNEPNWASLDMSKTADSVYMRLGIITRMLYNQARGADKIFPSVDEQDDWYEYCISTLRKLEKENQSEVYLKNMESYIDEYIVISIEQNDDQYLPKGCSILEQTLEKLLKEWEMEINSYKDIPLIQWLKSVYEQNKDATKPEWLVGVYSLLRDFHHYFPSSNNQNL